MSKYKKFYQILDVGVSLESDSTEALEIFERDYSWFKTRSIEGRKRLSCLVKMEGKDSFVHINSKVFSLNGHPNRGYYIYQLILNGLLEEVRDFLLVHAGVVEKDGEAVILAGSSGVGKTTMVLKLLEGGFTFLSDEFCPIHKKSGFVYPFPRSVWVSNQSTTRSFLNKTIRRNKISIKPDELKSSVAQGPCKAGCLIYLDSGDNSDNLYKLEIGLKEGEDELLRELQKLKGIIVESLYTGFSEWRIQYPKGQGFSERIREILEKYEQQTWNVYRTNSVCPDFNREPVLTPIPVHEASFLLIQHLKQLPTAKSKAKVFQDLPGRFFMKMNELLVGIPCYRLSVGKLEAMVDLVLQVLDL